MRFSTLLFDLDDTLYPASNGLWRQIKARIGLYMLERLHIPADAVDAQRQMYFEQYGTALRGLQRHYPVDVQDFLAFVHDVPLSEYLAPNPLLRSVLLSLPQRKLIFTNADVAHARRVLHVLQLEDCFDGIIDVQAINPYCKPMPQSFTIALKIAAETEARRCVMIDDIARTTRAAREQGLFSILFGVEVASHLDADATLMDWAKLPEVLDGSKHAS